MSLDGWGCPLGSRGVFISCTMSPMAEKVWAHAALSPILFHMIILNFTADGFHWDRRQRWNAVALSSSRPESACSVWGEREGRGPRECIRLEPSGSCPGEKSVICSEHGHVLDEGAGGGMLRRRETEGHRGQVAKRVVHLSSHPIR